MHGGQCRENVKFPELTDKNKTAEEKARKFHIPVIIPMLLRRGGTGWKNTVPTGLNCCLEGDRVGTLVIQHMFQFQRIPGFFAVSRPVLPEGLLFFGYRWVGLAVTSCFLLCRKEIYHL